MDLKNIGDSQMKGNWEEIFEESKYSTRNVIKLIKTVVETNKLETANSFVFF